MLLKAKGSDINDSPCWWCSNGKWTYVVRNALWS